VESFNWTQCRSFLLFLAAIGSVTTSFTVHAANANCASDFAARPEFQSYHNPHQPGAGPFLYKTKTAICSVRTGTDLLGGVTRKVIIGDNCNFTEVTFANPAPRPDQLFKFGMQETDGNSPVLNVGFYYFGEFPCAFAVAQEAEKRNRKVKLHYDVSTGDGTMMAQLISITLL
jgi:hypothetical protein